MATITVRAQRVAELAAADRLAEAALEVAKFRYPTLDTAQYLDRIDGLAQSVDGDTHLSLRRVIAIREGIGGNVDDYYSSDNSFLNRVLDTRRGIPISLSILWMEVGRRAGLEMVGVGLPGHFVVYAGGQMVDPFHYGEAIGFDEAAALVANALGGAPRLDRSWLSPVGSVEMIDRLLRNLEAIYRKEANAPGLEWTGVCGEALSATTR